MWISAYRHSDALTFWNSFYRQICTINSDIKDYSDSLNKMPDKRIIAVTLDEMLKAEFAEETYLVIDDFQNIYDEDIWDFLKELIKSSIGNLHVLLIARKISSKFLNDIPTFYDEIKIDDLRLNEQEIEEYADVLETELTQAQIKQVMKISNGWFSAAYILISGIKKGIDIISSNSKVERLIKGAIYDELSNETQQVLLRLSFLDSFTLEQATYILDNNNADTIIHDLYINTSILSYDRSIEAYVIHDVLNAFLQRECKRLGFDLKPYYKKAGEWAIAKEMLPDAIQYYHLSGKIYELFEKYEEIIHIDRYCILPDNAYHILGQFNNEDCKKYPRAFIELGLVQMLQYTKRRMQIQGAMTLYAMQQMALKDPTAFGDLNDYVLGETYLMGVLANYNNIEKMNESNQLAKKYFNGEKSAMITRYSQVPINYIHSLYSFYKKQGRLKKCRDDVYKWFVDFAYVTNGCSAGANFAALAEYYLETGDVDKAEQNAHKAMYTASMNNQLSVEIVAAFTLLRVYLYLGKQNEAFECIENMKAKIQNNKDSFYKMPFEQVEGYIYSILGQEHKIAYWLTEDNVFFEDICAKSAGFPSLIRSKIFVCKEEYNLLEAHIGIAEKHFGKLNNRLGFIHNTIYQSIAQNNLNQKAKAKKTMQKAIKMCEEDKIIMPFVECAQHILPIITEIYEQSKSLFIKQIIKHSKHYMKSLSAFKEHILLSSREKQVLVLAAQGYKRDEIAKELNISVNTVKKHLSKIYEKLNSKNKTEALVRARELKMI